MNTREHIISLERHFSSSNRKQLTVPSLNIGCFFLLHRKDLDQRSATVTLYAAFRGGLIFDFGGQTNNRSDKLLERPTKTH